MKPAILLALRASLGLGALAPLASAQVSFLPHVDYPTGAGSRPLAVVAGDFDHDDRLDLASANFSSDDVSVLLNSGGAFSSASHFAAGDMPVGIAADDIDLDGDLDLAVALFDLPGGVALLENQGLHSGTFALVGVLSAGVRPSDVVLCDLDGQLGPDLVVCDFGSGTCNQPTDAQITVLLSTGGFGYAPAGRYPVGCNSWALASCDLDGDGLTDVVVANDQSPFVSVLLGTGGGAFGAITSYVLGAGSGTWSAATSTPTATRTWSSRWSAT